MSTRIVETVTAADMASLRKQRDAAVRAQAVARDDHVGLAGQLGGFRVIERSVVRERQGKRLLD